MRLETIKQEKIEKIGRIASTFLFYFVQISSIFLACCITYFLLIEPLL